jgi:hypothetical protein
MVSEGVQLLTVVVVVVIPHTGKSSRGGVRLLWSQQCGLCSFKVALVVRSVRCWCKCGTCYSSSSSNATAAAAAAAAGRVQPVSGIKSPFCVHVSDAHCT